MLFSEGKYPIDLILLENTSMTLTEADNLKKTDQKRFYRFIFFIQEKLKKEVREIEKLTEKASGSGSGESDTYVIRETIPDDHVSEIGEMKD